MNYYEVAMAGMQGLIVGIKDPLKNFKKKLYADAFKKYYESNLSIYEAIEKNYLVTENPEKFLQELSLQVVKPVGAEISEIGKKSKQDKILLDYNLCVVVYVLPAILEFRGKSSQPLADAILGTWKEQFPTTNLQAATFEQINNGFQRKYCYITTAVCHTIGKEDDCYELNLFRNYRDQYLASAEDGEEVIRDYYDLAPTIVKHINKQSNSQAIYEDIWLTYLKPCVSMIEKEENKSCRDLYMKMVQDLKQQYFIM